MEQTSIDLLARIADALERLAPPRPPGTRLALAEAYVWNPMLGQLAPVQKISRVEIGLLKGVDQAEVDPGGEHIAVRARVAGQQRHAVGRARDGQIVSGQGHACDSEPRKTGSWC